MYAIGHENEYNNLRFKIKELKNNFQQFIISIKDVNRIKILLPSIQTIL